MDITTDLITNEHFEANDIDFSNTENIEILDTDQIETDQIETDQLENTDSIEEELYKEIDQLENTDSIEEELYKEIEKQEPYNKPINYIEYDEELENLEDLDKLKKTKEQMGGKKKDYKKYFLYKIK